MFCYPRGKKSSLHGKRVFNNNFIVIKLIATYAISKGNVVKINYK